MTKLRIDTIVTTAKLKSMELAFKNNARYLVKDLGHQGFITDEEDNILAYLSLFEIKEKEFNCFLIPTVHMYKYGFRIARMIKKLLQERLDQLDWEIVQTVSKNDNMINRWMKFMEFEKIEPIKVPGENGEYFIWRRTN